MLNISTKLAICFKLIRNYYHGTTVVVIIQNMRFISNHILFFGRVVAIVIFLSSSGFTTILHACTMEVADCCAAPEHTRHNQCDEAMPVADGVHFDSNSVCHINSLIGGLAINPAVVEKQGKTEKKDLSVFVPLPLYSSLSDQDNDVSSFPATFNVTVVFPSAEKYVLNASFLI